MIALPLELVQQQPGTGSVPLPQLVAGPTGLLVFIAFLIDGVWRFARHISVMAHEGAHVAAGWSVGRRVSGVKLNRDATGVTTTRGSGGFGSVIFSFAGYLGPSLFGLATACLIALDQITLALGLALFCLAIMLILIRNFFGVISVAVSGVLVFLVLRYGSPEVQAVAACALSWFLLFSGVRWVLIARYRSSRRRRPDAAHPHPEVHMGHILAGHHGCRSMGRRSPLDKITCSHGPGVSAEAHCADFHKPLPRKRCFCRDEGCPGLAR